MKKVKALKGRMAVLLIASLLSANMSPAALGAVFKNSMRAQQPTKLQMSEENIKMSVGDEKELTVSFVFEAETRNRASNPEIPATGPETPATEPETPATDPETPASPPELTGNVTWSSSAPGVVTVSSGKDATCKVTAVGVGPASVTATVMDGNTKYTAKCQINVTKEQLNAKLSRSSIGYSEFTVVSAEVETLTKAAESGDATFTLDYNESALDITSEDVEGRTASYTFSPISGMHGDSTIKITAEIDGKPAGEKELSLTVKKPEFVLTADKKALDVKGGETAVISVDEENSEFFDYSSYKWSVEGAAEEKVVEIVEDTNSDAVKVIARNAGTATVSLRASDEQTKEGPGGLRAAKVEADAKFTLTVKDSREFKADLKSVLLDINPDAKDAERTKTIKITGDYEGTPKISDFTDENIHPIALSLDPDKTEKNVYILTVSTESSAELDKLGNYSVKIMQEGAPSPITLTVGVISSKNPLVVEPDIEADMEDDAVKTPEADTGDLVLDQEQQEQVDADIAEQKDDIEQAIKDVFEFIKAPEVKEAFAEKFTGISEAVKKFGNVAPGEAVSVYPKQQLSDVQLESVVTKKADGTLSVSTIIKQMTFDIQLLMDRAAIGETGINIGDAMSATKDTVVSFPVPLPSVGIKESARYARVTHGSDPVEYYPIQETGGARYVVISTTHFSEFVFEFVDSKPSTGKPSGSGGGRGGSASNSANWSQGALGWRYKGSDGIYASNTWKTLLWNGTMQWFRFSPEGYMVSGWFTDLDGNKYFLHNIPDGSQGRMYTGWNQIEGKWYYFKELSGGPIGSLLVNGVTPDGYTTGADGSCPAYIKK